MIADKIKRAQAGEQQAAIDLIDQFSPLLKKYAGKLSYEDAYYDLRADFLDLIYHFNFDKLKQNTDGAMVNYLAKSVYRNYIKLMKRQIASNPPTACLDELSDSALYINGQISTFSIVTLHIPHDILSDKEWAVFLSIHYAGYSSAELAKRKGVSRQSINQMKRRAEEKLRRYLIDTGQYKPTL